jgi:hypothetical protein
VKGFDRVLGLHLLPIDAELGAGTFAYPAAMLNPHLQHLHVPLYERPEDPNLSGVFPSEVDLGFARTDYSVGAYEMVREWRNTLEQRNWSFTTPLRRFRSGVNSR